MSDGKETIERLKKVFDMHPDEQFDSCRTVIIAGLLNKPPEHSMAYKAFCLDVLLNFDQIEKGFIE